MKKRKNSTYNSQQNIERYMFENSHIILFFVIIISLKKKYKNDQSFTMLLLTRRMSIKPTLLSLNMSNFST